MFAAGLNCRTAARLLNISAHTVRSHTKEIRIRMGSKTLTGAVANAIRRGEIFGGDAP